ncbi:MAG: DeoR family transcriptional regulator [Bacteroidaceae bacterium]|nr:DeoR family transcriptional regulator [Bacteroidaceae bacterium]
MTDVGDNVGGNVGGRNATKFTERQKIIFGRLIETGQINVLDNVLETSASLATHFKVDARTIRRDLSVLQTKGFILHDGPDKGGRWVVVKG